MIAAILEGGGHGSILANLTQSEMEEHAHETVALQDAAAAKTLAFHRDVRTRCITLEGDDFNPGGTLTGAFVYEGCFRILRPLKGQYLNPASMHDKAWRPNIESEEMLGQPLFL